KYLEESPNSFSLRGQNVKATVFFSDIANFTGIGESLPPEDLTRLLNLYLTPITNCIIDSGGYLDKYVGDGVMAVWGAPYPDPGHAINACKSAIEQQKIIEQLNSTVMNDFRARIHVRMGIGSGIVTAGNMGSEKKFQYTVIGDVVNLAARLEPSNKDFGTAIIIDHSTRALIGDAFTVRLLGRIVVVGKTEAVPIYELLGYAVEMDGASLDLVDKYETAFKLFCNREWHNSNAVLDTILSEHNDGPSRRLKAQIAYYQSHSPDDSWKGEYFRTDKY
ncbi:MAG: adenylate/guanylate cyclase domain-containing protein, partial [Lentisphaerae bacterium]|nr:adenylate/guanylate cyclase domain-containing protein [Lentisphaerota bacterium]